MGPGRRQFRGRSRSARIFTLCFYVGAACFFWQRPSGSSVCSSFVLPAYGCYPWPWRQFFQPPWVHSRSSASECVSIDPVFCGPVPNLGPRGNRDQTDFENASRLPPTFARMALTFTAGMVVTSAPLFSTGKKGFGLDEAGYDLIERFLCHHRVPYVLTKFLTNAARAFRSRRTDIGPLVLCEEGQDEERQVVIVIEVDDPTATSFTAPRDTDTHLTNTRARDDKFTAGWVVGQHRHNLGPFAVA